MQILMLCNSSAVVQQASPQLAVACLSACVRNMESFTPDELAQVVFLSPQNKLRLNSKCPDKVKQLVHVGVARAGHMTTMSLSQFLFGVAAVDGIKQSQLQVSLLSTCQGWVMTAMSLPQLCLVWLSFMASSSPNCR